MLYSYLNYSCIIQNIKFILIVLREVMSIIRKHKLYMLLAVLTIIFLFGTAAICSQCSRNGEPPGGEPPGTEPVVTPPDEKEPPPGEVSAPTIKLSIMEGYPKYLEESGICYYRVEAEVTGSPTPDVVFSQDDSEGSWGDYIAQVNIASVGEVITLTAAATNSEGSDDASIELSWGCEEELPPEGEPPDDEGVVFKSPDEEIIFTPVGMTLNPSNIGYVIEDGGVNTEELIIGDSVNNQDVRGFFSFDVTPLAGKTIDSAKLVLKLPEGVEGFGSLGDPSFKGTIWLVIGVDYTIPLTTDEYDITGPVYYEIFLNPEDPLEYSHPVLLKNDIDLKSEAGELVQFIIRYQNRFSNGDNIIDGRRYRPEDISLIVGYSD